MQKRTRIKKHIFTGIIIASLAIVFSACGQGGAEKTGNAGNAEERAFGVDYTEELAVPLVEQVICGQENAWAITSARNDFIYRFYDDSQGTGIEIKELAWQPGEGNYSMINIAERDGVLYAEFRDQDEDVIQVRKYREYIGWSDIMSVEPGDGDWGIMGSGLFVDGSENVYLVNGDTVTRFEGEGKKASEYELKGDICTFQENGEGSVLCVAAGTKTITLYELEEGRALEKWTWEDAEPVGQVHGISSNEEGTLCLAASEKLLFFDIESGSLLAETDMVKIGVASVLTGHYDGEEGTLRLYGSKGSASEGLCCSRLSGRDAAEQRTELVYGLIGESNASTESSIWTAINTFNQENENYYITIKNYGGWSEQDRFRADLAAGNGPDIIDMTYFVNSYDSLVKNGYLEDLSPYLEQSEYKDDIIWNVLNVYEIDGGVYMFIPQFSINGCLIHPDYVEQVEEWNMETFLELIQENRWEKDILNCYGNQETLLRYLLFGMQEKFIDKKQKTASFEMEEFYNILALCKEYAVSYQPDRTGWTTEDYFWNNLVNSGVWGSEFYHYLSYAPVYGREYQLYGYPTLSGQAYGIWASYDGCAIYAGSGNKEGAWEFIESLLWDSNQKYPGMLNPGYPIRISMLEELEEGATEVEMQTNLGHDSEKMKVTEAEIEIQKEVIYNGDFVNFSVMIDSDIWTVVQEEASAYFAGDKTAEETAHIIQSRVGIILAE